MKTKIDYWLQRLRWIPLLVLFMAAVQVIIWAAEREPPFHVIKGEVVPPTKPGGTLRIEGDVYRDISRECYVTIIHWIEDSAGFRHFLPSIGLTHESIKRTHAMTPGKTKYVARVQPDVPLGPAVYHAENKYVCNPWHLVVAPIVVVTDLAFEVVE